MVSDYAKATDEPRQREVIISVGPFALLECSALSANPTYQNFCLVFKKNYYYNLQVLDLIRSDSDKCKNS